VIKLYRMWEARGSGERRLKEGQSSTDCGGGFRVKEGKSEGMDGLLSSFLGRGGQQQKQTGKELAG
jgi:hypothetical protein